MADVSVWNAVVLPGRGRRPSGAVRAQLDRLVRSDPSALRRRRHRPQRRRHRRRPVPFRVVVLLLLLLLLLLPVDLAPAAAPRLPAAAAATPGQLPVLTQRCHIDENVAEQ